MGLLDKFKKPFEGLGKRKKARNVIEDKKDASKKQSGKKDKKSSKDEKALSEKEKSEQKKEDKKKDKRVVKDDTKDAYRVLKNVVITEKASMIAADRQYVFAVATYASKRQVRQAIENVYGVHPTKVRIVNVSGRDVRFGRVTGRTANWKKAVVTLKEGEKIDLYEGV
ncbi:50S ribosomal protein L23 [Patescibacteria group bacterium]